MCCNLAAKEISRRIFPTEEAILTLPLFAHPCAAMLLTYVWMCANGDIRDAKSRIFTRSAPRSRLFIVTSPVGLEEDTRRSWVLGEKGNAKKFTDPLGLGIPRPLQNPMHQ